MQEKISLYLDELKYLLNGALKNNLPPISIRRRQYETFDPFKQDTFEFLYVFEDGKVTVYNENNILIGKFTINNLILTDILGDITAKHLRLAIDCERMFDNCKLMIL